MKPHETKAMLKAWQEYRDLVGDRDIPETGEGFRKGFEAALAMQKKPKWGTFEEWWFTSKYRVRNYPNVIDCRGVVEIATDAWEAARK